MTGFSDHASAETWASLLPDPPPADFDWVEFLDRDIASAGYAPSDIRIIDAVQPPAFQLLGNAVEKWVVHYEEDWRVRAWQGDDDEFAEGHWNEDLS
jgi:hypothetical protein